MMMSDQTQLSEIQADVKEIKNLLAGDKFGREGLVSKTTKNHQRIAKLEEAYKRIAWLGGIGTGLLGLLITFKEEIKAFFASHQH